jgi:hypothetical protein
VRFDLLPGQRHATAGAALIEDMALGGRIADKAFASNWIFADMNERGAQIVISQLPRRKHPLDIDMEKATFDRKLLPQNQRVQTHRHARRQNRPKLRRHDLCRFRRHQFSP